MEWDSYSIESPSMTRCKIASHLLFTPFLDTFLTNYTLIFASPGFLLLHDMTFYVGANTGNIGDGFIVSRLCKKGENTMKIWWKMMTKFLTYCFCASVVNKVDDKYAYMKVSIPYHTQGISDNILGKDSLWMRGLKQGLLSKIWLTKFHSLICIFEFQPVFSWLSDFFQRLEQGSNESMNKKGWLSICTNFWWCLVFFG